MEWRRDAEDRLVGERNLSFFHSVDVAGEPEIAQIVEERGLVVLDSGKVGELVVGVGEALEIIQGRFQSRNQHEATAERVGASVEIERRGADVPTLPRHVSGVDVVEVGEQGGAVGQEQVLPFLPRQLPWVVNETAPGVRHGWRCS